MKTGFFHFTSVSVAEFLTCIGLIILSPSAISVHAEETKATAPQVALTETYNAVTRIYFTNTAVHKGSHKPGLVERRFRADVKSWLMDAKDYDGANLASATLPGGPGAEVRQQEFAGIRTHHTFCDGV
jgi:hypothetical protein